MPAWPLLLAAPAVGSFLGVLVRRLPRDEPVALGRSRCEACGTALGARDLVPLLSYAALGGRCRHCRAPIAGFHWQIELAALAVAAWAWAADGWAGSDPQRAWADAALGWTLLALAWIDSEAMLLPDVLTLPLLLGGLLANWWLDPTSLTDCALGAGLGWGLFAGVAALYRRLRGREGLGEGDAKLLGAAGAWVGWQGLPWVMLLGAASAILATLLRRAWRSPRAPIDGAAQRIPFGPWLALALWLVRLDMPAP
jgi:leader peptidase (prepilin peptidase)/N-methyltransferase